MSKPPEDLDDIDDIIDIVFKKDDASPPVEPEEPEEPRDKTPGSKKPSKKAPSITEKDIEEVKKANEKRFERLFNFSVDGEDSLLTIVEVVAFAEFAGFAYSKRTMSPVGVTVSKNPDFFRKIINPSTLECKSTGDQHSRIRRKARHGFSMPVSTMRARSIYPWEIFYEIVMCAEQSKAMYSVVANEDTISITLSDVIDDELPFFKSLANNVTIAIASISEGMSRVMISMCRWASNYTEPSKSNGNTGYSDALLAYYDTASPFHDAVSFILNCTKNALARLYMEGANVLTMNQVVRLPDSMPPADFYDHVTKNFEGKYTMQKAASFMKIMLPGSDFTTTNPDAMLDPAEFISMTKTIGRDEFSTRNTLVTDAEKEWIEKHVTLYSKNLMLLLRPGTYRESHVFIFIAIPDEDSALSRACERMIELATNNPDVQFEPIINTRYDRDPGKHEHRPVSYIDHISIRIDLGNLSSVIRAVNDVLPENVAMYFMDEHENRYPNAIVFRIDGTVKHEPFAQVK